MIGSGKEPHDVHTGGDAPQLPPANPTKSCGGNGACQGRCGCTCDGKCPGCECTCDSDCTGNKCEGKCTCQCSCGNKEIVK